MRLIDEDEIVFDYSGLRYISPPDYIDRKEAIRQITEPVNSGMASQVEDLEEILREIPAADVAQVRHGRWKTHLGLGWVWRCSCCQYEILRKHWIKISKNYCPNCGAKMDGGGGDA